MFKNVASQKLTVFAFADAGHASLDPGEPVTGDAAQITCKVEQDDDGTQSATNDVNPTEVEDGQYRFDLTQAETNGDKLTFYPQSSTAGVQVVALPSSVIYTRPQYFGDIGIESNGHVHGDVKEWLGTAVTLSATTSKPEVDMNSLSDDATAANDLEAFIEALGTDNKVLISSDAQDLSATLDVRIGAISNGAITSDATDASFDAIIQSECDDALVGRNLDHLLHVAVTGTDITDNSVIAKLVSASATADWDDFVNTTDSLQAIRDRGDAAWITGGGGSDLQVATGSVEGTPTAGGFDTDLTDASNLWDSCTIIMTSGTYDGQVRFIEDYNNTNGAITLDDDLEGAPSAGDTFKILGIRKVTPVR